VIVTDWRQVGVAETALAYSTCCTELDAAVWTNNTVRVMGRGAPSHGLPGFGAGSAGCYRPEPRRVVGRGGVPTFTAARDRPFALLLPEVERNTGCCEPKWRTTCVAHFVGRRPSGKGCLEAAASRSKA
jgi:hypothetical protein